jgi:hypothetical protein
MFTTASLDKVICDGEVKVALSDLGVMFIELQSNGHGGDASPGGVQSLFSGFLTSLSPSWTNCSCSS